MLAIGSKGKVMLQMVTLLLTSNAQLPMVAAEKANERDFKFRLRGVTD